MNNNPIRYMLLLLHFTGKVGDLRQIKAFAEGHRLVTYYKLSSSTAWCEHESSKPCGEAQ